MKAFNIIECDDLSAIQEAVYRYIEESTTLLKTNEVGWHFLDHKQLLKAVPSLAKFFFKHKLVPRDAAAVILTETGQLPLHVDELPVVAKINFPISNTKGWVNRWYDVDPVVLINCPKYTNQFGSEVEMLSALPKESFRLVAEIMDLDVPIVFNSRIPHEVVKLDGDSPRIIVSFTFVNEPLEFLK